MSGTSQRGRGGQRGRGRGGRGGDQGYIGSGRGGGGGRNAPPPSQPPPLSHAFEGLTLQPTPRPSVWARPPAASSSQPPPPKPAASSAAPPHTQAQAQARPPSQGVPVANIAAQPRPPTQGVPVANIAAQPRPPSQGGVAVVENIAAAAAPPAPAPSTKKAVNAVVRPGYGRAGRRCVVRANHFLVQVADRDLHHYDVSISPEVTSKRVCRDIIAELVKEYRDTLLQSKLLAYDGSKSAYCAGALPFTSKEFVITLPETDGRVREKKREFKVSIKFAAKADLHHLQQFLASRQLDAPHETIQALDVVLRAKPSSCYETVGRSFFSPTLGQAGELGNGLQYWKGFYQSLRPTQMGLSLNIDMSARGFYEPILVNEFVAKFFNKDPKRPLSLSDQDRLKVRKVLKGLKVQVNHQGHVRRYKVSGLSTLPLARLTFPVDESGAETTVIDYFRDKYNIALRHTSLPSILAGSEAKPAMLPMEVCTIVEGQRYTRKLNEKQVTELLRATCQRPGDRETSIRDMVKKNNYNGDELVNKEFGIQVSPQPTTIEARVLPAPMLKYHESGRETRVDPRVGQWNMIGKKMVNGAKVESWTCVSFARSNFDLERFCWELIEMCCSKGMDFNPDPLIPIKSVNPGQIEKALHDIQSQSAAKLDGNKKLQLLIIVLPDISGSYGKIKRICETELGIVSQCCQPRQASKCNKQYLENVALKINVKTGGRNSVLEQAIQRKIPFLTDQLTIVFGADVTHPAPGEDSSPSIAAVVGSMDWPEVTKYRGLVSAQLHRKEIISDLFNENGDPARGIARGGMIRELLLAFYKNNMKQKPARIIFYRDGVSEGQFNQVLLEEVDAIRKACVSLQPDYLPRVTFIVVQKRHHTRLFPEKHGDRNTTDKSGNILPGTVVDTKICHPIEFDFYLNSHAGIQGTSRPAHYHVLYDENQFTADGLQLLTNNLCYTYARCTRSVSIVPPAYYAHLAAFRARYYMEGEFSESGSSHAGSSGRATRENPTPVRALPVIKENVKDVMFYC